MVDNLPEKVEKCPLDLLSIVCVQMEAQKLSIIRSSGVSAVQRLLKYWSECKDSHDFRNCPLCHGCLPFRGVH